MNWLRRTTTPGKPTTNPHTGVSTFDTLLPSTLPGLHFHTRLTTSWALGEAPDPPPPAPPPDVRARSHITRMAATVTRQHYVTNGPSARDDILLTLSLPTELPGTPTATARVRDATVTVTPEDLAQAKDHLAAQRHEHLRSYRTRQRTEVVRTLLADTGLAHAWWLTRSTGESTALPIDAIDTIVRKIQGTAVLPDADPTTHDPVAQTTALLLSTLSPTERLALISQLPGLLELLGHHDHADHPTPHG
ncbi:hypothetical protein ACFFQW_19595 [Umezawaea endophytica]|uniref:Uncharacterized protein n=1 Tax=Umezawaea endophytica TaxID=1654476 RepID=A0A9X3AG43_9PSEU|nr:hypothetical protein [Umezawaea endophytica]MCS7479612.1 hypothetical protein [Umezawaea endophytica]